MKLKLIAYILTKLNIHEYLMRGDLNVSDYGVRVTIGRGNE